MKIVIETKSDGTFKVWTEGGGMVGPMMSKMAAQPLESQKAVLQKVEKLLKQYSWPPISEEERKAGL